MFQGSQKPARHLPDLVPSSCALAPRQTREAGFLVVTYFFDIVQEMMDFRCESWERFLFLSQNRSPVFVCENSELQEKIFFDLRSNKSLPISFNDWGSSLY